MKAIAPVNNRFAVGRKVGVIERRVIFGEDFGTERLNVESKEGVIGSVAFAGKEQPFAVRAPAVGNFRAGMPGQLARPAAVGRNSEDIPIAIPLAGKSDPF